ncbi:uncharacterized protein LOC129716801 [Wyeomyia smithii]|uniref:uncharacterized protein LOC129716801 n=1 Tax=Wyeomyia smithii TaxID=174621 RepID=UPI0024681814|nr:uncharacterized protein LOC129716801 [Wyeomyia smithii]
MAAQSSPHSTIFLATIEIRIEDRFGNLHSARALIDSGSQSNFVSKKLSRRLCLHPRRVNVPITGIGEATVTATQSISSTIYSKDKVFFSALEFLVLPTPTAQLPSSNVDVTSWNIPENLPLADTKFNVSGSIDVLLGIDQFHEYLKDGKIIGNSVSSSPICHTAITKNTLESAMEKFWELEALEFDRFLSPEEAYCDAFYKKTVKRNSSGRYVVRLPRTKNPKVILGDSKGIVEKRLFSLECRLNRDETIKAACQEFLDEYMQLGHMRQIVDTCSETTPSSYLPHHPVFKTTSSTTKTRVVFDASCRTSSGYSLNDTLFVGPVVQEDLVSIVMRFRSKAIALVADIEKMYRQIGVHPDDQPLQKILWRKNTSDPIATFQLQTVTYGTASAPFLATRTLVQLAEDEGEAFP